MGRPYSKDWERRFRVLKLLGQRQIGITQLSRILSVSQPHVSEVIWGTRRSPIMEERIAAYFGMTRFELFPRKPRQRDPEGRAA